MQYVSAVQSAFCLLIEHAPQWGQKCSIVGSSPTGGTALTSINAGNQTDFTQI